VTTITCPNCGKKNRVATAATGVPRCGNCHNLLPWIVDADPASFEAETTASVPVLVDFWAPWCGPCRMVSPALEQIAGEFAGRIKLVKVNADESPVVSERFEVLAIPTLLLMEHGEVIDKQVGAAPVSHLRSWVTSKLNLASS
jgi:thioredoxin 2